MQSELVDEIDSLLEAIDEEIALLDRTSLCLLNELDSRATQDLACSLSDWAPVEESSVTH